MLSIEYDHDDFPPGTLPTYGHRLSVTWDDLVWAAITVGRPDFYHVFQHGDSSVYEAVFRWSMLRMALEQHGPSGRRLYRTAAFKHMDPTEKGAVNYFLGLVVCKLFAAKLLDAPWTLHLDIWRDALNAVLLSGRSRPDMIAQSQQTSGWYAFECKGRASSPNETEQEKAKEQAQRIVSVNGAACALHIGSIMYYRGDTLQFYWRDPEPSRREQIDVPLSDDDWGEYYRFFMEAYRFYSSENGMSDGAVRIKELDLALSIHPAIAQLLSSSNWREARLKARELGPAFKESGFRPDGLCVIAGASWLNERKDSPLLRG